MKYDFNVFVLQTADKKPMPMDEATDKSPFTAAIALARALLADTAENNKTKLERYDLFLRVRALDVEYSAKDVALLREAALVYPTLIAGQLVAILDQK